MNRLFTLKETLPVNLANSESYPNVEFLLLDYNSNDGLEQWVKENLQQYIESGKLVFYKLIFPEVLFFSHSHSRNVIFRLALGEILCNVNADYFIETGFLEYVNESMDVHKKQALVMNLDEADRDNYGRICLRRQDYWDIRGFDEAFNGYGYEDIDLYERLKMAGVHIQHLTTKFCSNYVSHSRLERIKNMPDYFQIDKIFIRYIDPTTSEILFLHKNFLLERGKIYMNLEEEGFEHVPLIYEKRWINGKWQLENDAKLILSFENLEMQVLDILKYKKRDCLRDGKHFYYRVKEIHMYKDSLMQKALIFNNQLVRNRLESGIYKANPNGFGEAIVQKNFMQKIAV